MTIKIVYVVLFGEVYMKSHKICLNLSVIILFVSLIISSAPFTALAQSSPEIFDPLELTSFSLDGVGANFDDVAMPKANPAYNGFIAPPDQDPIPVDAVHIQTAQQLAGIGGAQSANKYYVLDNDINLVDEWVPIADFRGTFDGRGHSVNNLYVLASSNRQYAGLFGRLTVAGVAIKNVAINTGSNGITASRSESGIVYAGGLVGDGGSGLSLVNCFVVGDVVASSFGYSNVQVGGLAGSANIGVSVLNCYVVGDVTGVVFASSSWSAVGGLIGQVSGDASMENCYVAGDITAYNSVYVYGVTSYVGGLVGFGGYFSSLSLMNCFVVGDVTGVIFDDAGSTAVQVYVGGLVGYLGAYSDDVFVENCYVEGNVATSYVSSFPDTVCVGGLVGHIGVYDVVSVVNCFVVGDVVASSFGYGEVSVGGLVGYSRSNGGVVVEHCSVVGDVFGSGSQGRVGGLVGYGDGVGNMVVDNCSVVGNVSVSGTNSIYSGAVCVGGLVGYGSRVSVVDCFVIGDVTASVSISLHYYAGGLVGYHNSVMYVESCFVVGDVTSSDLYGYAGGLVSYSSGGVVALDCFVVGDVTASNYAGGLAGYIIGRGVSLVNCYFIGNVLSSREAGDLVSYRSDAVVESCYSLSTKQISAPYILMMGVPLSVEDMQRQESFVGWDFDNIWAINPDVNGGFPYLRFLCGEQSEIFPTVPVSNVVGKAGDEVTLTVTLENNPGIASYSLTMVYPSELEFVCAEQGDVLDSNFRATTTVAGQVSLSATSENGDDVTTGTVLFTITFKIGDDVEDGVIINENAGLVLGFFRPIDAVESDGKRITCVFNQGQVVVNNVVYGDVNEDGFVDFLDVTRLLRYLWEVPDTAPFNALNADTNGDGFVDFLDVTRLLRYLWEVDPSPLGPKQMASAFLFMPFGFNEPAIKVSNEVCQAGDEVTLSVSLTDNPGIASFSMTMEYPDELTFIEAKAGDIINSNFNVNAGNGVVAVSATSENGVDVASGTILFTVTFRVSEESKAGCIDGVCLGLYRSIDAVESRGQRLGIDIVQGSIAVEKLQSIVLVSASANTRDFISIAETSKNSGVWMLSFKVMEVYSTGETKVVPYAVHINANNANVADSYNLGAYTLIYDIKGNGSNIKDFRIIMN